MNPRAAATHLPGFGLHPGFLDAAGQRGLLAAVRAVLAVALPFRPAMPRTGKPMSVAITNAGPLGWVTDRERGYRYQASHPMTGQPWPAIPPAVLDIWGALSNYDLPPEACLINLYVATARMGLHRDADEKDFSAPVVSISLGDDCLFRIGGLERADPTRSFRLGSGDVLVLGGASRLAYHGVDRIFPGTSPLLDAEAGGVRRINLTLRRVSPR